VANFFAGGTRLICELKIHTDAILDIGLHSIVISEGEVILTSGYTVQGEILEVINSVNIGVSFWDNMRNENLTLYRELELIYPYFFK